MMVTGVLASSCTKGPACTLHYVGGKIKPSKNRKAVRKVLRTRWNHHQTRMGRLFNINVF